MIFKLFFQKKIKMNSILYSPKDVCDVFCHPTKDAMIICEHTGKGAKVYLEYNNISKNSNSLINKEYLMTHKGCIAFFAVSKTYIFLIEVYEEKYFYVFKYSLEGKITKKTFINITALRYHNARFKMSNDQEHIIIHFNNDFVIFHETKECKFFHGKKYIGLNNDHLCFISRDDGKIYLYSLASRKGTVLLNGKEIYDTNKSFSENEIYLDGNNIYYTYKNEIFEIDIEKNSLVKISSSILSDDVLSSKVINIFKMDEYVMMIFPEGIYALCLPDDKKSFKKIIPKKDTELLYNGKQVPREIRESHDDKKIFFYRPSQKYDFTKRYFNFFERPCIGDCSFEDNCECCNTRCIGVKSSVFLYYMSDPKYIKFKYLNKQMQDALLTTALMCKRKNIPKDMLKLILANIN